MLHNADCVFVAYGWGGCRPVLRGCLPTNLHTLETGRSRREHDVAKVVGRISVATETNNLSHKYNWNINVLICNNLIYEKIFLKIQTIRCTKL